MYAEFFNTKDQVYNEMKVVGHTFAPGLSKALWDVNLAQLQPTFLGMAKFPSIEGVKLENELGKEIGASGIVITSNGDVVKVNSEGKKIQVEGYSGLFHFSFPIIHKRRGTEIKVGKITIYSSNNVVFDKVKLGFVFIVINSIIKTLALWMLVLFISRRILSRPLAELAAATKKLDLDNLEDAKIDIKTSGKNELKILEKAFNFMVVKLLKGKNDLAESEKKYRGIFENALEGIFQITMEGRFIDANPALAGILGYKSPNELIKSITNIERQLYVDPRQRSQLIYSVQEQTRVENYECQLYRKNRSVIWVSIQTRSILEENGEIGHLEGILEDITERKRVEEELKEYRNHLEDLVKERTSELEKEITERKQVEIERVKLIGELQEALEQVKQLKGLIPICANCKKIRDDKGYWNHLESYIEKHSDAQFSHSICQECADELYGDEEWYKKRKKDGKI